MHRKLNVPHRKRLNSISCSLLFGLLSVLGIVSPLEATIISTGNVDPVGTWTSSTSGYVGNTADGSLLVDAGSALTSLLAHIAYNSDVLGTVTVTGANSKWTNGDFLRVGEYGSGKLSIGAGGQVSDYEGYLGYYPDSSGAATITGAGSVWTNYHDLYIGQDGSGTLRIEAGGQVSNFFGYLADGVDSVGIATVTGAGSKWTNDGYFYVGNSGTATLRIEAGGQVTNSNICYLGYRSGSSATATVTGAGSKWTSSSDLYIGVFGTGSLTVEDGGEVIAETLYAGCLLGNGKITAAKGAVLDADLRFDAAHPAQLQLPFGSGGTLTVNAAGGVLGAGYKGNGSLNLAEGVTITSSSGYLGYHPGSCGTATVTGTNSKWTNSGSLYIGNRGTGALLVEAGGHVNTYYSILGNYSDSSGTATITGTDSMLSSSYDFYVGYSGSGKLLVEAGGQVSSRSSHLGNDSGSSGTATVAGAGSKWSNSGSLYVGDHGTGILLIEGGGQVQVSNSSYTYVGYRSGSIGSVSVTGAGSTWTNSSYLFVGNSGTAMLRVESGGQVGDTNGFLGYNAGSIGTVTVTGAGSKWINNGSLVVGAYGSGLFRIEAGGQVNNSAGFLGQSTGKGTATVTGSGSKWLTSGSLYIGEYGTGTLCIEAGGQVSNSDGYIGYSSSSASTATVTGSGSTWINSGSLHIGEYGTATLRVEAGGQVSDADGYIGYYSSYSATAAVTITGAGSMWTNSGSLTLGNTGSGNLHIRDGGMVTARSVSMNNRSLLTLEAGHGNNLRVGDGTGAINNDGTVRLLVGPQPASGSQYSPITAGTWSGSGTFQALGGTWNATSHVFTVSQTFAGVSGMPVSIDLAQRQRILATDSVKSWSIGASFLAKSGTGNSFNFTATAVAGANFETLNGLLEPGHSLLSAWSFTAMGSGYFASDPIYLSLGIPVTLTHDDLQLWRQSGSTWSRFTVDDLTANGGYANFTSTGLSGYAVAALLPSAAWKTDADGVWQSGSHWTTTPNAPGGVNVAAVLGSSITAPRTVTIGTPLTLGVLTFASPQHYTLAGSEPLNLAVNPGYTAQIDVQQSDAHGHVIETPLALSSPLEISIAPSAYLTLAGEVQNPTGQTMTLSGGGTLTVTQGLTTTGAINVQAGTLITPSLKVATLIIGGGSATSLSAVPEPSSLLLLLAATIGIVGRFLFASKNVLA